MTFDQLKHFSTVAKTQSFTVAAHELFLSISALSQSISSLETELGLMLFKRSRSGAHLTAEGALLIEKAEEIMKMTEEFQTFAQAQTEKLQGHLRISTIPGPSNALLAAVFSFKKEHPNVSIELQELGPKEITEKLINEEMDVGMLVVGPSSEVNEDKFHFEPLLEGYMVAGVQAHSALAEKPFISKKDLSRYPIILYQDAYLNQTIKQLLDNNSQRNLVVKTNHTNAITQWVSSGNAITIGLDYSFQHIDGITGVKIQELKEERVHYGWVHLKKKHINRLTDIFLETLNQEMNKLIAQSNEI